MTITKSRPVSGEPTARKTGESAEKQALSFLQSRGLRLIERNYACKHGEIDLVMQHSDSLVFVEVRYRKHRQFGSGAESVDRRKQLKILKTAEFFLQRHVNYSQLSCRIDVISIGPDKSDLNWITNAIEA